jgi:hypothetical protein
MGRAPEPNKCQTQSWPAISEGNAGFKGLSLRKRIKHWLKRQLNASSKRKLKVRTSQFYGWINGLTGNKDLSPRPIRKAATPRFRPGDVVRVRSREEIAATLNSWNELKGCLFMPDMWQYCGTVQVVLKPVERFVDERDYRVKHARGLVILERLLCIGTPDFGRCDRGCFYFWREEWLDRIGGPEPEETGPP